MGLMDELRDQVRAELVEEAKASQLQKVDAEYASKLSVLNTLEARKVELSGATHTYAAAERVQLVTEICKVRNEMNALKAL